VQQQEDDFMTRYKRNFNIVVFFATAYQRALVVPMRNRWGKEAQDLPCGIALIGMLVYAALMRDNGMWLWIAFWMLCQLKNRAETARLMRNGERIHTLYEG
jgi:hypothetical protein